MEDETLSGHPQTKTQQIILKVLKEIIAKNKGKIKCQKEYALTVGKKNQCTDQKCAKKRIILYVRHVAFHSQPARYVGISLS